MARVHIWQFLLSQEGQPIADANINVYLAGTMVPATVFSDEYGTNNTSTLPQTTTNSKGYFEFWIADESETGGYSRDTKFKLEWEKAGIASGYIDYVDVFSTMFEVDETDSVSTVKNKLISNRLGFLWTNHISYDVREEGYSLPVHGIEAVDETSTDQRINKLISNYLAHYWEIHRLDEVDDHLQYARCDGTRGFSVPVQAPEPVGDSDLATKGYVDRKIQTFTVATTDWDTDSDGNYTRIITHNMDDNYPIVVSWNLDTGKVETGIEIETINSNNIKLIMYQTANMKIKVAV